MSSSGIYKRISQLINRWPLDSGKPGRDLGQYLRELINKAEQEGKFVGSEQYWDRQYLALERLTNNEHAVKSPRGLSSSATGLSAEQCHVALTKDVLDELDKKNSSVFRNLLNFKEKSQTN